ncbi:MAG: diguanylate cyclase [Pseudomonadota bacterium]
MIFSQIFEMVNVGIVILDKEFKVYKWNRWMETYGKIPAEKIVGASLFTFFPDLNTPSFRRNFKAVTTFGNFAFFSQNLHGHLFPFKATNTLGTDIKYMQQNCTMGPIRDENNIINYVYIMVHDVTEIAVYEQKLLEMNIKDPMTGVYNRRYLESCLEREFEIHKRYKKPLSLIMLDIDFFKRVNDTCGHQCGDSILIECASFIDSNIRTVDILARYGGEEFCCLLPETRIESALSTAERIRKKIEDHTFHVNKTKIKITVSQGVAVLSPEITSPETLLKIADSALYKAKEDGRNRTVTIS